MSASLTPFFRAEYVLGISDYGEVGRNIRDQVCVDHGHLGLATREGDRPLSHGVYQELGPDRGGLAGDFPA